MADEDEPERTIRDRIESAVANAVQSQGALLIKFIVITDYLDSDGDRMMAFAHTDGLSTWDKLGMLEFVKADLYGVQASNNVLADSAEED